MRGEDLARYWAAIYFSLGTPIPYGGISIGDRPWSPVVIEQDDGGNKIARVATRDGHRGESKLSTSYGRGRRMNGTGTAGRDRRRREGETTEQEVTIE